MSPSTRLSRRLLLHTAALSGVGVAVGGCNASGAGQDAGSAGIATPAARHTAHTSVGSDSDVDRVRAAIADERALLAFCTGSATSHPAIARALTDIAGQQRQHVAALRGALTDPGGDRVVKVPRIRGDRKAVLLTARRLLVEAQRHRRSDALAADSGPLARLFASISASHAVAAGLDRWHA